MNTQRQIELVQEWGFTAPINNETKYIRNLYNQEGYLETWLPSNPDYIQFFTLDGTLSHDYHIKWSLFN